MRVGVIDYGVGNLGSVLQSLEALRVVARLVDRPVDLHTMDALILPGVGNFSDCAKLLETAGWRDAIREEVLVHKRPLLGICLGMQLLASSGTEGLEASVSEPARGLDLIPGRVVHLGELGCRLRVPHVGWNSIHPKMCCGGLFDGIRTGTDFYFVHSYAFVPELASDILATCEYGITVTAAVQRGTVLGTQFHPEKSSRAGFRLLRNFVEGL
jgi:glutamine amidotransferase